MTGVGFLAFASRLLHNLGMAGSQTKAEYLDRDETDQMMFPKPCIQGVGWAEEQGKRPTMEDEMVTVSQVEALKDCWIQAVYDGHGGKQTAAALSRRLHFNFLSCLRKLAVLRWEQYRQRAALRAQKLFEFRHFLELEARKFPSVPLHIISDYMGALRLEKILEWIVRNQKLRFGGDEETSTGTEYAGCVRRPPHYLSVCCVADVEAAAREAFIQTDYEILQYEGITSSGATACFCFMNPVVDIERILTMKPGHLKDEDWDVFFPTSRSLSQHRAQSSLIFTNLTVAHVGDTRAVLVFSDGDALRLTSQTDHKASDAEEVKRVEKLGGWVFGERVNSCLAIGRALGDWNLKLSHQELVASQSPQQWQRVEGLPSPPSVEWRRKQREYVVSHVPHVRSINLSEFLRVGSVERMRSWRGVNSTPRKIPVALVVGCDGLFDVCSDRNVAQLCTQFLQQLSDDHPDMTPGEAGSLTASLLVEESILHRGSTDNVSVQVSLLDSFGFSRGSLSRPRGPLRDFRPQGESSSAVKDSSLSPKRSHGCGAEVQSGWGWGSGFAERVTETFQNLFVY